MPFYDFRCDKCDHNFEVNQPISQKLPEKCPKCKKKGVYQIYDAPYAMVRGADVESVGTYAERNTKKLGKNLVQEKEEIRENNLPESMKKVNKARKERPWWRPDKDKPDMDLAKKDTDVNHYIMTGEKRKKGS